MSSLQELIKKIQVSAVNTDSYVYYNKDTGKIHKISSTDDTDDEYSVVVIPNEEVRPILTGERRIEEFIIFYDVSLKQIRLKELIYEDAQNIAATMCYELPVIKNTYDGHIALEQVYEGADVYIWDIAYDYSKNQCVWYDGNVYKLTTDTQANAEFDINVHKIFVKDVLLTELPTQKHTATKLEMFPEYIGIHVDVWYKELSHLAGQHIWLNGTVYKLLTNQEADTEFTMDNVEIIVNNVKLYADKNKFLKTVSTLSLGDVILKNNSLFSIQEIKTEIVNDKKSVFFYTSPSTILYHHDNAKLPTVLLSNLKNGQIILCGKSLYLTQINKKYDLVVCQNTINKEWKITINPYTKQFLITSEYNPKEILYFSVTSKYDPNILYRSLEFTVGDLLSETASVIPFKYDIERDTTSVSIYTAKYFENYAHEVI
jgi:hypothetical protein